MSEKYILSAKGMSCQHCVARVEKALSQVNGVESVRVTLEDGKARVEGSGLELDALLKAVAEAGYEASPE